VRLGRREPRLANERSRRPSWAGPIAAVMVAAAAAGMLGRMSVATSAATPAVGVPVTGSDSGFDARAARSVEEASTGWPRSRQGAVAAAATYAKTLSERWFLTDAGRRHRAVDAIGAPEAVSKLQASQDVLARAVARGAFGAALTRRGVASLLRTSLLGYRVDRYTSSEAEIALWAVVLYGNDSGGALPQALFATSTLRVRWADDWKLVTVSTVPGPVPFPGQGMPTPAATLIRVADGFKEFSYAPA
jgi:hypothetical protein